MVPPTDEEKQARKRARKRALKKKMSAVGQAFKGIKQEKEKRKRGH